MTETFRSPIKAGIRTLQTLAEFHGISKNNPVLTLPSVDAPENARGILRRF
jgi:hypothetical protein